MDLQRTHELVQQVLGLNERMRRHYATRVEEFGLTPPQAHLMRELAGGPRPMGELAGRLGCDASNVTGLTDRLEARGLVARRPAPGDRRVKVLELTDEGRQVQDRLWRRLMAESPVTQGLTDAEQARLLRLLQRLSDGQPSEPSC